MRSFCGLLVYPARKSNSIVSVKTVSIFMPSVNRESRGKVSRNPFQSLYASVALWTIGNEEAKALGGGNFEVE